MSQRLIAHGAEARIYTDDTYIYKQRLSKSYRIPELDNFLIKKRTKSEKKILDRLKDINVPKVINISGDTICMEKIEGNTLKEHLNEKTDKIKKSKIFYNIGELVRSMHNKDVIHGDITPLNIIINNNLDKEDINSLKVYLIDFGLAFVSKKVEDVAVDLFVFEKSINSFNEDEYLESFYQGYNKEDENKEIMERLKEVRMRGRKRD